MTMLFLFLLLSVFIVMVVHGVNSECGVYMAPSTIPHSGIGLFAGNRPFEENDLVLHGDVLIPIVELNWHNGHEDFFWLWDEYTWSPSVVDADGMESETEGDGDLHAASPGMGSAVNCFLPLVNTVDTYADMDLANVRPRRDAGAGAFTPYHNRQTRATQTIRPGQELYIDYGQQYFATRLSTYGHIPFEVNYQQADKLLHKYQSIKNKTTTDKTDTTDTMWKDLYERVVMEAFASSWDSRTMQAFPSHEEDIQHVLHHGGTAMRFYNRSRRSVEWLEQHGDCVDNLRDGTSTIPQAGRGAFATRFLSRNSVVAPSPLIHIPERSRLIMFDTQDHAIVRNTSRPLTHQLLLNYCFGHRHSTLLLSPYGVLVSLINHNKTRANVRLRWSNKMRHPEWLENDHVLTSSSTHHHTGLMLEYVATRDIQAGEEILLDYGDAWEEAWLEHVQQWTIAPDANGYHLPAYELNNRPDLILEPYRLQHHLLLWIHNIYRIMHGIADTDAADYMRCRILDRYPSNQASLGTYMYTVETYYVQDDDDDDLSVVEFADILWFVPRDAFVFDDLPYTRDHQMPWAFRYPMAIPDDMFPEPWKNLV